LIVLTVEVEGLPDKARSKTGSIDHGSVILPDKILSIPVSGQPSYKAGRCRNTWMRCARVGSADDFLARALRIAGNSLIGHEYN